MFPKHFGIVSHIETVNKVCMNICPKCLHFEAMSLLNFRIFEDNSVSSISFSFFLIVYKCIVFVLYKGSKKLVCVFCYAEAAIS